MTPRQRLEECAKFEHQCNPSVCPSCEDTSRCYLRSSCEDIRRLYLPAVLPTAIVIVPPGIEAVKRTRWQRLLCLFGFHPGPFTIWHHSINCDACARQISD
jgi:hypothetical protein